MWMRHTLPDRLALPLIIFVLGMLPLPSGIGTSYTLLHPLVSSPPWAYFSGRILRSSQQPPLQLMYKERDLLKDTGSLCSCQRIQPPGSQGTRPTVVLQEMPSHRWYCFRARVLHLGTIDIWGWINLCFGGWPMQCRVFRNTAGL